MPSRINTIILGDVAAHLVDISATGGRGTPRYALRSERGAQVPPPAQAETVFVPGCGSGMPLLDEELQPIFRWAERICRDPSLSEVHNPAVPAALQIFTDCNLAGICAGRGCALTVIVGRRPEDVDRDEDRAVRAHLETLAASGADIVHLVAAPTMPTTGRAVVCRALAPDILASLEAAKLDVFDAIFATAEQVSGATGLSRRHAVALQLALVEEATRYRAAIWPGVEAALDVRLATQAAALRRLVSSGVGQRPPPAAPARADGAPSTVMVALAGSSHSRSLEMRPPRLGEAVALVPVFDAATGTSGVVHMQPHLADALRLTGSSPQPRPPVAPSRQASRRPGVVARLLGEIRRWRADRG